MLGNCCARHRLAEDVVDHHRYLGSLIIRWWVQFLGGALDRDCGGLPERTRLFSTEHPCGQPFADCIRDLP